MFNMDIDFGSTKRRRQQKSRLAMKAKKVFVLILKIMIILAFETGSVASNYDTSMVDRLLKDRHILIQDGLSYFNGTTLQVGDRFAV